MSARVLTVQSIAPVGAPRTDLAQEYSEVFSIGMRYAEFAVLARAAARVAGLPLENYRWRWDSGERPLSPAERAIALTHTLPYPVPYATELGWDPSSRTVVYRVHGYRERAFELFLSLSDD